MHRRTAPGRVGQPRWRRRPGGVQPADGKLRPVRRTLRPGRRGCRRHTPCHARCNPLRARDYRHCKPIAATGDAARLLARALDSPSGDAPSSTAVVANAGVISGPDAKATGVVDAFVKAMAQHRFFEREAAFAPPPDVTSAPKRGTARKRSDR